MEGLNDGGNCACVEVPHASDVEIGGLPAPLLELLSHESVTDSELQNSVLTEEEPLLVDFGLGEPDPSSVGEYKLGLPFVFHHVHDVPSTSTGIFAYPSVAR